MKSLMAMILLSSTVAMAVPRGVYLASPEKVEVVGEKMVLTFKLPCQNEAPNEWAGSLVAVSDDEGDLAIGVGVALAKKSCVSGPAKEFKFQYDLKELGISSKDIKSGTVIEPITL